MKDFKHIATFTYPSDLAIARSLLESMLIECYVKDELTIQVHNFYSNAIGGVTLAIPKDKYNTARSLLIESGFENSLVESTIASLEPKAVENFDILKILKFSVPFIVITAVILILIVLVLILFYDK